MLPFAYGQHIIFEEKKNSQYNENFIYVKRVTKPFSLEEYEYKITFFSNQGRPIYIRITQDIQHFDSLGSWMFIVEDTVIFFCNTETHTIEYFALKNYSDDLMHYWLYHLLLPIYLTFNTKYYFLHAGSVIVNDNATLFMGESYAGKSTLTDFFLKQGHTLVSDDKLATFIKTDKFMCEPSHNRHRPYRELETLGITTKQFQTATLPIGTMYWITPVLADDPICIQEVKGLQKFKYLRYSTEMDLFVNMKNRFAYLAQLANKMPLYELQIPRDIERLPEVYEKIVAHATSQTEGKI